MIWGLLTVLIDKYGRPLLNVRFVITLRCNFRCIFCHRENSQVCDSELSPDELSILAEAFAKVGVRKYKITGGEPLLRDDVVEIVKCLKSYGEADDISITTNGFYLREHINKLVEGGLNRINVSLHSLRPSRFEFVTGVNALERVVLGIKESLNYSLSKIKLNFVALKGVNEDEVWDIIRFAEGLGIHVQLIELHPVGRGRDVFSNYYASLSEILTDLREKAVKIIIRGELHNRPIYVLPSGTTVEVVRPVLNPIFCAGCSRIRVSPNGALIPCLNSDEVFPTTHIIKEGSCRDKKVGEVVDLILRVNNIRRPHALWPIKSDIEYEYLSLMKLGNTVRKFTLTTR
ncbi:MAG: GTP 3',8-cyclase MoaA [Sulfolobales archaeon]